jgi:hypothetical protein
MQGILEGSKEVAVKRLSQGSGQGIDEFRREKSIFNHPTFALV